MFEDEEPCVKVVQSDALNAKTPVKRRSQKVTDGLSQKQTRVKKEKQGNEKHGLDFWVDGMAGTAKQLINTIINQLIR